MVAVTHHAVDGLALRVEDGEFHLGVEGELVDGLHGIGDVDSCPCEGESVPLCDGILEAGGDCL